MFGYGIMGSAKKTSGSSPFHWEDDWWTGEEGFESEKLSLQASEKALEREKGSGDLWVFVFEYDPEELRFDVPGEPITIMELINKAISYREWLAYEGTKELDNWREEWRREIAMEAGMCLGVEAYNDHMGY